MEQEESGFGIVIAIIAIIFALYICVVLVFFLRARTNETQGKSKSSKKESKKESESQKSLSKNKFKQDLEIGEKSKPDTWMKDQEMHIQSVNHPEPINLKDAVEIADISFKLKERKETSE